MDTFTRIFRCANHIFVNVLSKIVCYKEERFLDVIFRRYIDNNLRAHNVLNVESYNLAEDLLEDRGLPSAEHFQKSGWWKKMFLRYGIAMHFSKGKDVLETCSGLGWGAYLLDGIGKSVTCIEIDKESINQSKKLWKTDRTVYINASVLRIPTKDDRFDVVTAMESIEHFKLEDIKIYLSEIYRVLKKGGFLIGSSSFPDTREEANTLCSKYKYHLHICTKQEITNLLRKQGFKKVKVFHNRLFFIARK